MLNFNHDHVGADLSSIKQKTSNASKAGKVMVAGVLLSGVMLLSGCGNTNVVKPEEPTIDQPTIEQPITTSSAIIMENGNAMIVDAQSYKKYSESAGSTAYESKAQDRTWVIYTTSGDKLLVDFDSVKFIDGEDSHEKAETIAQALVGGDGLVTCYDEIETYGKTK